MDIKIVTPNCVRCKSENFRFTKRTYEQTEVLLIFCGDCGAVLGCVPAVKTERLNRL
ncbi:MAG: hypothetical protein PHV06_04240 [bacterium]|nr:hypothetical protein [bacterium]